MEDSAHEFYSCGEDAVVFHVDVREPKANKFDFFFLIASLNSIYYLVCYSSNWVIIADFFKVVRHERKQQKSSLVFDSHQPL